MTPIRKIVYAALVAALYAALTLIAAPISFGLVQCRISESLTVLPFLLPAAVPGLFAGCLLANLLMGAPLLDVIAGSIATLLAAAATAWIGKRKLSPWLAPLPAVIANGLIVGYVVMALYAPEAPYGLSALYVALGEGVACYLLGMPLLTLLRKYESRIFK